ncbi:MAG: hypothetical protein AB9917_24125 [Negativicutes bacterium]
MRSNSDEKYVLDLVSEILGESYEAQKRFDTLRGDPGKNERRVKLPLDAFFPGLNLIVEYREKQHFQPVAIMDRRITVSGVHRGEQRKIYDHRKEKWATDNKIQLLVVSYIDLAHNRNGRLIRNVDNDRNRLGNFLETMKCK